MKKIIFEFCNSTIMLYRDVVDTHIVCKRRQP